MIAPASAAPAYAEVEDSTARGVLVLVDAAATLLQNPWTWAALVVVLVGWFVKNHSADMVRFIGGAFSGWWKSREETRRLQQDIIRSQYVEAESRAKEAASRASSAELAENEARNAQVVTLQGEINRYREDLARAWGRVDAVERGQRECAERERSTSYELATMGGKFIAMKDQLDKALIRIDELSTENRDLRMSLEIVKGTRHEQPPFQPPELPTVARR